jgi:putative redox protein
MKTVAARLDGDGMRFVATTSSDHSLAMDSAEGDSGPRPSEVLLAAQAGCTGMDVISILRKKRQAVTSYEVRVSGQQRQEHPRVFEQIRVIHRVEGDVSVEAVRRAIELSASRYCMVTGNLASGRAQIVHLYVVRDASGEEHYGEVLVTGPNAVPDEPGTPALRQG